MRIAAFSGDEASIGRVEKGGGVVVEQDDCGCLFTLSLSRVEFDPYRASRLGNSTSYQGVFR